MTKEEFEAYWVSNWQRNSPDSTLTLKELYASGFECVPCTCGEHGCQGWRMHFHIPNLE